MLAEGVGLAQGIGGDGVVIADLVHLRHQGDDGGFHSLVHQEGDALQDGLPEVFRKRGLAVGQVGEQGQARHGALVILGAVPPGAVPVLLLLEPLEGFDHGFLALGSAPVFRDALHAVVQVAALGDDAGNAASVPVARAGPEAVADVDAHGKLFRGDVHFNVRIDHRDVRRGYGGNHFHLRGSGRTAGALGGLGDFRGVDIRIVAFLGGVGHHGGIFRNGDDDMHQIKEKAHEGDAEEGDGNGGGQRLDALFLQFRKGVFGTFNVQAHAVREVPENNITFFPVGASAKMLIFLWSA